MVQTEPADAQVARQIGIDEWERSIEARFQRFHRAHPEVYAELVRRSRAMHAAGRHFGVRTLWEAMRWDFGMAQDGRELYKLNDHYTSRYARLIMDQEPDLDGIFSTRELKGDL